MSMIQSCCLCAALLSTVTAFAEMEFRISTVAGNGEGKLGPLAGPVRDVPVGAPFGVEIGPDGALYVCEVGNHRVLRLDRDARRITTVAGTGEKGYDGDGGPATKARLNEPYEVRFDRDGHMYFVEMRNAVVRRIEARSGTISTIAGTGRPGYSGDGGPATRARLKQPHSIALDEKGSLYIADIGNHRVRRVELKTGVITTVAGNGEARGPAPGAASSTTPILGPRALSVSGETLWIALREGHSIWKLDLQTRRLDHVAGSRRKGFRDGKGREAMFDGPKGIVAVRRGPVYVVDTENQTIRRIDPTTGIVTTIAGVGPQGRGFGGDDGPARKAKLDRPHGITVDDRGRIYIGDTNNHRVRRLQQIDQ